MLIRTHESVKQIILYEPSVPLDLLCSRGALCVACLTPMVRPPTDAPFFSSIARVASSVTALLLKHKQEIKERMLMVICQKKED